MAGFFLFYIYFSNSGGNSTPTWPRFLRFGMCGLEDFLRRRGLTRFGGRFDFACAPAYGSEVVAFGDGFVPGTEAPGFYLETLSRLFWFGVRVLDEGWFCSHLMSLRDTWGTQS